MEHKDAITIDGLAQIVQNGFLKIDERFNVLGADVAELKHTVRNIEANLNKKVDKIKYNTLEYRVERLEKAPAV